MHGELKSHRGTNIAKGELDGGISCSKLADEIRTNSNDNLHQIGLDVEGWVTVSTTGANTKVFKTKYEAN